MGDRYTRPFFYRCREEIVCPSLVRKSVRKKDSGTGSR
jgi:hypothetical protein